MNRDVSLTSSELRKVGVVAVERWERYLCESVLGFKWEREKATPLMLLSRSTRVSAVTSDRGRMANRPIGQ